MNQAEMMGFKLPDDQRVPVLVRDWNALKLALWRSKTALDIAMREAEGIVARCAHMEGCAGKEVETESCLRDCPDRELRMSALVILSAARQLTPAIARKPANAPYYAPSREYFSEVLAKLAATEVELETLRAGQAPSGTDPTLPPSPPPPPQLSSAQQETTT